MATRRALRRTTGKKTNSNDNNTPPTQLRPLATAIHKEIKNNARQSISCSSRRSQQNRLLEELIKVGPKGVSTFEARHRLNIPSPAPRVHELRHERGLNIQTIPCTEANPEGYEHRIGRYVLLPGKWKGASA